MRKLLITGASGFLGWNLCRMAKDRWDVYGLAYRNFYRIDGIDLRRSDLTSLPELRRTLRQVRPEAVIHAAAISSPNFCQLNPEQARLLNVEATRNLACLCAELRIPFAFISSDMVFNGLKAPYGEDDPVCPVSIYGEQKAEAEEVVLKSYPRALVCRMALMFGDAGPGAASFIQPWISAMRNGVQLDLFTDEYRTPVSGMDAAGAILHALPETNGVLHIGGLERISRFDFGKLLRDVIGAPNAPLSPWTLKNSKMPAPRPPDLSLKITRAVSLGFKPGTLRWELEKLACTGGTPFEL